MNLFFLLLPSFLLAALAGAAAAGFYLAWPRPQSVEEWVLHRREVLPGRRQPAPGLAARLAGSDTRWARRLRWLLRSVRADLRLLALGGPAQATGEEELVASLARDAAVGAAGGLVAGLALWAASGHDGPPTAAALLLVGSAGLLPALRWLRLRRRASEMRAAISRRLPRLLTGSRVLLESGAVTPRQALTAAVAVYRDPAADVLREALLDQEVRRVELPDALDRVGRTCSLEPIRRLADGYRIGTRQGTQMADLLAEFALDLRRAEHSAYRERMTRAPVVMTVPALVFFVLPLLAMVLFLVLSPLEEAFGQL